MSSRDWTACELCLIWTGHLELSAYAGHVTTERDVTSALARARELACEAVDAAPDGQSGYELAERLTDAFRDAAAWTVNGLRGRAARRIRDDEALGLRSLAARLGVSKSTAQVWAAAEGERQDQDQEEASRGADEREHGTVDPRRR